MVIWILLGLLGVLLLVIGLLGMIGRLWALSEADDRPWSEETSAEATAVDSYGGQPPAPSKKHAEVSTHY